MDAGGGGGAPPAPPGGGGAVFVLGPGRTNDVLDFTESSAVKLYYKAIAPLETKFDGQLDNIAVFLASVADRARRFHWTSILTIPVAGGVSRNLIKDYAQVTATEVRTRATTYQDQQMRDAQNSDMLYYFLIESLTETFKAQVLLFVDNFTINDAPDGICLLKQIVVLTYIDNRATTAHIRATLIDMSDKLTELEGNITLFNNWVRTQQARLNARGTDAPDLLSYLWKAYTHDQHDSEFVAYIKDLRNMYNDGRANHTSAQLMVLAENKYKERVQSGDWGQPSEEQAEIVALTAKLHTVEKQLNARSSSQTKKTSSGKQQGKASTKNSSNKRPATTADASNKSKQNKYAWKDVKPSGNETKVDGHPTKKKDDKLYYWCLNHTTMAKASGCCITRTNATTLPTSSNGNNEAQALEKMTTTSRRVQVDRGNNARQKAMSDRNPAYKD